MINPELIAQLNAILTKLPPRATLLFAAQRKPDTGLWHPTIIAPKETHWWPLGFAEVAIAEQATEDLKHVVADMLVDLGRKVDRGERRG